MSRLRAKVAGCGAYLPEQVVGNDGAEHAGIETSGRVDPDSAPASASAGSSAEDE